MIDGMHERLGDRGLITVECEKTESGEEAMYRIVKTVESFGAPGCGDAFPGIHSAYAGKLPATSLLATNAGRRRKGRDRPAPHSEGAGFL